ncbi:hypothetical protein [Chitinophaga sp. CF418]|uniref:hypothetical protein n=1 Tax=Chitinophaga sp. CF418 TaxID=1855287 RepID=UPI00092325B3|nr:hypothetical protein [Chitinophaga sp. CF418]SHN24988.1 hypothetical protein SAMN05216311_107299 [Chitinophaga sp. CF418]
MRKTLLLSFLLPLGSIYVFARGDCSVAFVCADRADRLHPIVSPMSYFPFVQDCECRMVSEVSDTNVLAVPMQEKLAKQIRDKSRKVSALVDHNTGRVLKRWKKIEASIAKGGKSTAQLSDRSVSMMNSLNDVSNFKSTVLSKVHAQQLLNGNLDSLVLTARFLAQGQRLTGSLNNDWAGANQAVNDFQDKFLEAERLKALVRDRANELKKLGFLKEYSKLSKEVYYYGERIREYREMLNDKSKLQRKAMEILGKMPAYQEFITRNSAIAGLFNLGSNYNVERNLEGLQVRTAVEQMVSRQIGSAPGAAQVVSSQLNEARTRFDEFKAKFPQLNDAAEMPDFKPNPLKAKTFFNRLEFGGNIQFQKSSRYFPTTTDVAGQVGYKFHKNGILGIGIAYKLGSGSGWENISFSHRGIGFRSFIDWRLKGSFFFSGGYERNMTSSFRNLEELKNWNGWQQSGLLGISKKYKKKSIIVLYDFLAARQLPQTDKIKIRIGRNF